VDKRRYIRLIAQLQVTVKRVSEKPLDEFITVVSKDISLAGIGLTSESKFVDGERLRLTIKLPGDSTIHSDGSVKWVTMRENLYSSSGHDFAFGVEFTQLSDPDRKEIEKFIAQTGYDPAEQSPNPENL
jgi:c-di-GMP-binding flagellar brake protein YcgR